MPKLCQPFKKTTSALTLTLLLFIPLSAVADTWYVQGGASNGGDGSKRHPFNQLASVAKAAQADDKIIILPSPIALDGGITLKPGQTLLSSGEVNCAKWGFKCSEDGDLAIITNSQGDAITLSQDNKVQGLHIVNPAGYAIYGENVSDVSLEDNVITGANQQGLLQQMITPPAEWRGFVVSLVGANLDNVALPRGAIGLVGTANNQLNDIVIKNTIIRGTVTGNTIQGTKGPEIALLLKDRAKAGLRIKNVIIKDGSNIPTMVPNYFAGIFILTQGNTQATTVVDHLTISNSNFQNDGIKSIAVDHSQVNLSIRHYHFQGNTQQGFMSQGLESVIAYGQGKLASKVGGSNTAHAAKTILRLEDSDIRDSSGQAYLLCAFLNRSPDSVIDLGSGPETNSGTIADQPSKGHNRFINNSTAHCDNPKAITVINGSVSAKNNWWGEQDTMLNKDGDATLNPKAASLCGVNFSASFCDGSVSTLDTTPALKHNPEF